MKPIPRILLGIVGAIGIFFGVRQMISGFREMSGKATVPQELGDTVTIDSHGCSMRVPRGWEKKDSSQDGVMFVAPKSSGFATNFIVMSEPFAGSLREYADGTLQALKTSLPTVRIKTDAAFPTGAGAPGFKLSFENKIDEIEVAQSMYFFEARAGRKIVITSTSPANQSKEIEPVFDASMKSLAVLP